MKMRGGAGAKAAASRWGSRSKIDRSKPPHDDQATALPESVQAYTHTLHGHNVAISGKLPRRITVASWRKFRCDR